MSERTIKVASEREWHAIRMALHEGRVRRPVKEWKYVDRFLERNHDATEDEL